MGLRKRKIRSTIAVCVPVMFVTFTSVTVPLCGKVSVEVTKGAPVADMVLGTFVLLIVKQVMIPVVKLPVA